MKYDVYGEIQRVLYVKHSGLRRDAKSTVCLYWASTYALRSDTLKLNESFFWAEYNL